MDRKLAKNQETGRAEIKKTSSWGNTSGQAGSVEAKG